MSTQSRIPARINWYSAIECISGLLKNDQEAETRLQQILDHIVHNLKAADVCIVWIHDASVKRLVAYAAAGFDLCNGKQIKVEPDKGLIGRVFQTGKAEMYIPSSGKGKNGTIIQDIFSETIPGFEALSNILCVPLNSEKTKYGVLTLFSFDHNTRYSQKQISFFQTIANMMVPVIENIAVKRDMEMKETSGRGDAYPDSFLPVVAHEMRTLLTSIKGYSTALLMEEAEFSSETQREFLEIVDKECDDLENLISNFLESSRIEAGNLKIDLQPVRLPHLAQIAVDEIKHRFPEHTLLVDFGRQFPLIDADPDRILQVLRQLLDNAAKYSPHGGMIILQGKIADDKAVVSVADEGVGISPENLNRLFDRYFRVKIDSGTRIIGTGLGLPISRAIVEAHGGQIWAESKLEQGSIFYFSLPAKGTSQDLAD